MDPEIKILVEKTLSLTEENNRMLYKVRRVQKRQYYWNVLKFGLIIGIALGLFYFLEPFLNKILDIFNQITGVEGFDINSLQDILKKF